MLTYYFEVSALLISVLPNVQNVEVDLTALYVPFWALLMRLVYLVASCCHAHCRVHLFFDSPSVFRNVFPDIYILTEEANVIRM